MTEKFEYLIKAHRTYYKGVWYRSRLEARWAAFFDLAGWDHEYEPFDLDGWSPDFMVTFPCNHSECAKTEGKRDGSHSLLIEVKPYLKLSQFNDHPCTLYPFGIRMTEIPSDADLLPLDEQARLWERIQIPADASAAFGNNTSVTDWQMSHGSGGGEFNVDFWVEDHEELWKKAGNTVQYLAR